jgi:dihydrolipoamide dehydrogenase
VGCIPSKALLNISHKYHDMLHASDLGINVSAISYDWSKILNKKEGIVTGLTKGIEHLLKKNKVDYLKGYGSIVKAGQVSVALTGTNNQQ